MLLELIGVHCAAHGHFQQSKFSCSHLNNSGWRTLSRLTITNLLLFSAKTDDSDFKKLAMLKITYLFPLFQVCQHDNSCYFLLPYHPPEVCHSVFLWTWETKKKKSIYMLRHYSPIEVISCHGFGNRWSVPYLVLLWICSFLCNPSKNKYKVELWNCGAKCVLINQELLFC